MRLADLPRRHSDDGDGPGFALLVLALVCVALLQACGGTKLDDATTSLDVAHVLHAGVVTVLDLQLGSVLDQRCGGLAEDAAKAACAAEIAQRWRATESGMRASEETLEAVTHAVYEWARRVAAGDAEEDAPPILVCEGFEQLQDVVVAWAALAGVPVPSLFACGGES